MWFAKDVNVLQPFVYGALLNEVERVFYIIKQSITTYKFICPISFLAVYKSFIKSLVIKFVRNGSCLSIKKIIAVMNDEHVNAILT